MLSGCAAKSLMIIVRFSMRLLIKGKAAKAFRKKLSEPLSKKQNATWAEAARVGAAIKRKDKK
jgi:hypothetical protein